MRDEAGVVVSDVCLARVEMLVVLADTFVQHAENQKHDPHRVAPQCLVLEKKAPIDANEAIHGQLDEDKQRPQGRALFLERGNVKLFNGISGDLESAKETVSLTWKQPVAQ